MIKSYRDLFYSVLRGDTKSLSIITPRCYQSRVYKITGALRIGTEVKNVLAILQVILGWILIVILVRKLSAMRLWVVDIFRYFPYESCLPCIGTIIVMTHTILLKVP